MKVSAVLLLGVVLGGCCMLAAANDATWANANCDCTRERAIVCGDDGTSYLNKCWAECSGTKVAHDGACHKLAGENACADNCPKDWNDPQCAVDPETGDIRTYRNPCLAECAEATIVEWSMCEGVKLKTEDVAAGENIPCPCTKERAIVCGADGHSYTNACWAACAHTDVVHQGPCSRALELPPCACTTERAIVCGADGHSYTNACWASCSGTSVVHDGACKKAAQATTNEGCGCHGWATNVCGADGNYYGSQCTMRCAGIEEGSGCKPCPIPLFLAPVCGKDGLTYPNLPQLKCTGVEMAFPWPCSDAVANEATTSCDCSKERAIVCGDDGHSYLNKCWAECSGTEVAHDGACQKTTQPTVDAAPCGCHGPSRLVCGADGKFYGNQCTLECAKVERGDGCEFCPIPKVFAPTCGKDGLTYVNPWELKCTGVEKDQDGACRDYDVTDEMLTSTECQKACAPVFEPVCGMNNKSYANKCRMECDGVELKHEGRCPINPASNEAAVTDEATTSCDCSKERAIVCGDDGHSYLNKCWAECSGTEVAHDGACQKTTQPTVNEGCDCHGPSRLVCGADGKFYGNQCTLECAGVEEGDGCEICLIPKVFAPTCGKDGLTYVNPWELKCTGVEKDHDGPCSDYDTTDDMLTSTECQKACAPVFEPVCGMNNKSYANKCRMECDGVELKHEGRCSIQTI